MKPSGRAQPATAPRDLMLGLMLAVAVVALPIGFFLLIASPGFDSLIAHDWVGVVAVEFAAERNTALVAKDIAGRYGFTTPSVLLRTLAVGAAVASMWVFVRRTGELLVVSAVAVVLTIAIVLDIWVSWTSLLRVAGRSSVIAFLFEYVLHEAGAKELVSPRLGTVAASFLVTNHLFTAGGTFMLLLGVLVLAVPARGAALDPDRLRRRRRDLNTLLLLGVALLITVIATERGMLSWPLVFLAPVDGGLPLAPIAEAFAAYWGAAATVGLLLAFGPAFLALALDTRRAADLALPEGSEQDRSKWLDDNGLAIKPLEVTGRLAVTLGPLLTVPALELLGALSP